MCAMSLLLFTGIAQAGTPGISPSDRGSACEASNLSESVNLTFHQRTCLFEQKTFSPSALLKASFFSSIAQVRNDPYVHREDATSFGHRLGTRLAENTSKNTAEYLFAALNHEDPRFHPSGKTGFWKRTESALWHTLVAHTDDGGERPAFSKMAGAFAGGLAASQCYLPPHTSRLDNVLARSGEAYGLYFSTAVFSEFAPEFKKFANRFLPKRP